MVKLAEICDKLATAAFVTIWGVFGAACAVIMVCIAWRFVQVIFFPESVEGYLW